MMPMVPHPDQVTMNFTDDPPRNLTDILPKIMDCFDVVQLNFDVHVDTLSEYEQHGHLYYEDSQCGGIEQ